MKPDFFIILLAVICYYISFNLLIAETYDICVFAAFQWSDFRPAPLIRSKLSVVFPCASQCFKYAA